MWRLVTVEVKGNAPWADDAIRRTLYTKRSFPPWNIVMMQRGSILVSPLGIGNKDCIIIDILFPICDLETKPLFVNIFGTLRIRANPPNKVENIQAVFHRD